MMNLMLNLMLRLLACCLLVLLTLLLVTRQPAPALTAPGFSVCALPCWAGVIPGETRYTDAAAIITANVADIQVQFPDFLAEVPTAQITSSRGEVLGAVYEDRGVVGSLRLDFPLPLWHLLETAGTPVCLQTSLQGADVYLYSIYWQVDTLYLLGIVLVRDRADWHLGQVTNTLYIFSGSDPCDAPSALPWQGFGGFNPRRIL